MSPDAMLRWFPACMRYLGLVGILAMFAVWLVANRVEPALLAMFGTLVAGGTGADALIALNQRPDRKESPSDAGSENNV